MLYRGIEAGITNHVDFYFRKNEAETKDSYYSIIPETKQYEFVDIDKTNNYISSSETVLTMKFFKSNQSQKIERSVFTLLDLLGLIGGVFEIFSIIGGILVYTFADRIFHYSILSNLYQVDTERCQKDHKTEVCKRIQSLKFVDSNRHKIQESKQIELSNNVSEHITSNINYLKDEFDKDQSNHPNNKLLDQVKWNIHGRRIYNYKTSDICFNLLCCCYLKKCT